MQPIKGAAMRERHVIRALFPALFLPLCPVLGFLLVSTLSPAVVSAEEPQAAPRPHGYNVTVIEQGWNGYLGRDINEHGQIAGTGPSPTPPPDNKYESSARRYDPRDGFTDLGAGNGSFGLSINNHGDVVGFRRPGGHRAGIPDEAYYWSEDGGVQPLGALGGRYSWAWGVNDRREVVGQAEQANGSRVAFLWTQRDGMRSLGDVPGGRHESAALHVTNRGSVVGYVYGNAGQHAMLWTERDGMRDLNDLPGGSNESAAFSANDRGQIVGYGYTAGPGLGYRRAVLWTEDGAMRDLGVLKPGDDSVAVDINNDGTVLGWSVPTPGGISTDFIPWIWTEEEGMRPLSPLLPDGWKAYEAGAINDKGEITIHGGRDGQWAMLLLSPHNPEPAGLLTATAAGFLLLSRRRPAGGQ
jgi:probable HAF family extracellular repeat protein